LASERLSFVQRLVLNYAAGQLADLVLRVGVDTVREWARTGADLAALVGPETSIALVGPGMSLPSLGIPFPPLLHALRTMDDAAWVELRDRYLPAVADALKRAGRSHDAQQVERAAAICTVADGWYRESMARLRDRVLQKLEEGTAHAQHR